MDISSYSKDIQNLITQIQEEQNTTGRNFLRLLAALKPLAIEDGDHALLGFLYFNYAGSALDRGEHSKVFNNCRKALTELLRSSDRVLTGLTYDLFGLEAHRLGCLDVSLQYYGITKTFVNEEDVVLMNGILETNTGDLLADMGDFRAACSYKRKSLSQFRKCIHDKTAPLRIVQVTIDLAMDTLYAGNIEEARKIHKRAENLFRKNQPASDELSRWMLILRAQIAFAEREEDADDYLQKVIDEIVSQPIFSMHRKDVYQYCRMMIAAREWKKAGTLLQAMKANVTENTPAYENYRQAQLDIEYARATGNNRKLRQAYEDRNRYYDLYRADRNQVYHESIILMNVADDLHREQAKAHLENEKLQMIAETDALTGIPNRYAMNRELEESFDRAYRNRTHFGIGIVDIDEFKKYNDLNGHQAGDECLRQTAAALSRIAEEHDVFLARYGGDEFVLIYEGLKDRDIRKIEKKMADSLPVSASHGFFNDILDEDSRPWDFFSRSDKELYAMKRKR